MILLGVLAVWLTWHTSERWVDADRWVWYLGGAALGIGWQLLDGWNHWWYGVGIGGAVVLLSLVADLLLVLTDLCKVSVLNRQRR